MEINNKEEEFILSTHFPDWTMAGVSRLWLGVRCSVGYNGRAEWKSHSTGKVPNYAEWGANEPSEDCDGKPMFTTYECEREYDNRTELENCPYDIIFSAN